LALALTLAFVTAAQPVGAQAQATTPTTAPTAAPAAAPTAAPTAAPQPFEFTIRNIMRGPELYGRPPENVRWSSDSKWIYFSWAEPGTDWREPNAPFRVRAQSGAHPERLTITQMDSAGPYVADGFVSHDGQFKAVASDGDIYLLNRRTNALRRLTHTAAREARPVISTDNRQILFVRDNNVFSFTLATGLLTQLTDLRTDDPPADSTAQQSAQRARLAQQQRDLFQVIRDRAYRDSLAKRADAQRDALQAKPLYLGDRWEIAAVDVAPSGTAALVTVKTANKGRKAQIPQYVTASGYTEEKSVRTKVGDLDERWSVLFVSFSANTATPLTLLDNDSLPSYVQVTGWSPDGRAALLLAFAPDNKSRLLYTVSATGALHRIEALHDSAWVDGPCVTCAGWYDQGRRVWYVSEASGYAQLYTATADGSDVRRMTTGAWEVRNVTLSPNGREFHITANEPSPFEEQFYRLPIAGGTMQRITSASGGHAAIVSPNGAWIADVYSYVNRPPDLYLMPNRAGASATPLTHSPSAEWSRRKWLAPEIVSIPASDGVQVPAHIYRPQDVGAQPNGAAVIFVHGAGYLHNVGNFWSQYPREYLFNQFLAQHGYVVLDLDYRGSDGYGRDWRTAIYRWMGGRDLQDHVDASKYLTAQFGIPAQRIGIYGGSYGGFMTLMALFTEPAYFGAGAALRSVTDWAHYNAGYTSNILNLPQTDTLAYRRSSPIYFAEGLRAPLLMCHGMRDNNVHYQDIVRLTQRLIELGKTNWELASYPVEDHAFVRPSSWTDEYTRIFALFERTIRPTTAP
jgi:dipeptidyl aminopeptidase/acylaminoacyl peptidase